jgi:hypothetical protein
LAADASQPEATAARNMHTPNQPNARLSRAAVPSPGPVLLRDSRSIMLPPSRPAQPDGDHIGDRGRSTGATTRPVAGPPLGVNVDSLLSHRPAAEGVWPASRSGGTPQDTGTLSGQLVP